jgi:hypothetical protein
MWFSARGPFLYNGDTLATARVVVFATHSCDRPAPPKYLSPGATSLVTFAL